MGRTVVEFGPGELRVVGGDYGTLELEGATPQARSALDAILGATRRRDDQPELRVFVAYDDSEADFIETRHAGREGTPESGVADDAGQPVAGGTEGVAA